MSDSPSGLVPRSLKQALLMLAAGTACMVVGVCLNTWAGARSWVGVISFIAFGLNGLWLAATGLYSTVVLAYNSLPVAWRMFYSVAIVVSVWLACLALFLDGASFARMTLSGWNAVWRTLWCIAIFSVARHLTAEAQPMPRFNAHLWSILVVAAVMWLGEQGVFSGPPEDDPLDVGEPPDAARASDLALFNYVTYSLAAVFGADKAAVKVATDG